MVTKEATEFLQHNKNLVKLLCEKAPQLLTENSTKIKKTHCLYQAQFEDLPHASPQTVLGRGSASSLSLYYFLSITFQAGVLITLAAKRGSAQLWNALFFVEAVQSQSTGTHKINKSIGYRALLETRFPLWYIRNC